LTQGQLVVSICVALAFSCLMFMLGMFVKSVDPPAGPVAENQSAPAVVVTTAEEGTEGEQAVEGEAVEPAAEEPLKEVETAAATPAPLAGTPLDIRPPTPRVTPLPSRSTPTQEPADVEVTPLPGEEPPAAASPEIVPTEPAKPAAPLAPLAPRSDGPVTLSEPPDPDDDATAVATAPTPSSPAESAPEAAQPMTVAAAPVPAPAAASPPAATGPMGKFGIQLASFQGDKRKADAEGYARQVREKLSRDARPVPSPDDKIHRVYVVGFASKDEASKVCEELKAMAGFRDAFVKPL
jgi:cell division septation protein DedD